mmetsp:Transcript_73935/g.161852  ORF Transcript_73935/g.161852 Transcript_73935/m.161852 type:complete len:299 (+) Transcript_73935:41-937(+)
MPSHVMIDAYDALGIKLNAEEDDIKKAYRKLSLQYHPDKLQSSGVDAKEADRRFKEITEAKDILSDADRRKIYDTFGIDLGEEKVDAEMWNMGMTAVLGPIGSFTFKTILVRVSSWIVSWWPIALIVVLAAGVVAVLFFTGVPVGGIVMKSEEGMPFVAGAGVAVGLTIVTWLSTWLTDTVSLVYFATDFSDASMWLQDWRILAVVVVVSGVLGWLLTNWWYWIIGIEVLLCVIVLLAVCLASQLLHLWIDQTKLQHGEKLRDWRLGLRQSRKTMEEEVASLKKQLEASDHKKKNGGR